MTIVTNAVESAKQHLMDAQAHLTAAAVLLGVKFAVIPSPGTDAVGVACHTCGALPPIDAPQCSWTNGGKAVCFGCGHG